jgi:hypothetical protein
MSDAEADHMKNAVRSQVEMKYFLYGFVQLCSVLNLVCWRRSKQNSNFVYFWSWLLWKLFEL